jgi:hypothetical protein
VGARQPGGALGSIARGRYGADDLLAPELRLVSDRRQLARVGFRRDAVGAHAGAQLFDRLAFGHQSVFQPPRLGGAESPAPGQALGVAVGRFGDGAPVPLVCLRAHLSLVEIGVVPSGSAGTTGSQTQLKILAPTSELLTAGESGTRTVTSSGQRFVWGKPASSAVKVASLTSDSTKVVIYRYETGATMAAGNADGRRVGFFLYDGTGAALTSDGFKLFDAAVKWAAGF